ncbi:helix-turn-helix domain-containing protein [Aedoeadaptatus acetigenes]|uniref:helix-turn-helix domain-containing protein n=1 Tax=Aedoeadaptatus acetigenes TaxID=2981723 RepID=UPI0011DD9296|nr:helix-turn-helix transcriptional regulator [Aedoeadaptatus acetigenes]MCU6786830.1 helix-turn-helix domain-containing protein [Aedoeadaptatus acetigenes]
MTFGKKIKTLRKERGMTQKDLAEALGLSLRTISNYETGGLRPRHDATYDALAALFHVPKTYFFTEEDAFISAAEARWGKSGADDARELVDGVIGLFAGGRLDEEDKQAVFEAIQEAYFRAKLENESKKAGDPYEQDE